MQESLDEIRGRIDESKYRQGRLAAVAVRVATMQKEEAAKLEVLEQMLTHAEAQRDLAMKMSTSGVDDLIGLALEPPARPQLDVPQEFGRGD